MKRFPESDAKITLIYWIGALILIVGVRLYLFANYYTIDNDGVQYIEAARQFWEGHWTAGLASFYPPVFPLMIAAIFPIVGDWETAGQMWPFIFGVLVVFPLFGLLRRVYGVRVARAALFFYAVSPYLARFSLEVRTELPYIFFLVLALYFLQRGLENGNLLSFFSTGVSSAVAYLTRPEGALIIIVGAAFLLLRGWVADRVERSWLKSSILILGFALFSAPYVLYLKWNTGDWMVSRKAGYQVLAGLTKHEADAAPVAVKKSDRVSIVQLVASRPLAYAKKVLIDAFRSFVFYAEALHYSYLPFLLIGWLFFFRGRFWERSDFLLMVFVLSYLVALSLFYATRRYEVPLATLSLGWVAVGYLAAEEYFRVRWGRNGCLITGLVLIVFSVGTVPKTLQAIGRDKFYLREGGAYLKQKPGNPVILTTDGRLGFYAAGQNQIRVKEKGYLPILPEIREANYVALDGGTLGKLESVLKDNGFVLDREFLSKGHKDKLLIFRRSNS